MGVAVTEVRICLLGPPLVEREGARVHFETRKAVAVLALLAAHGHGISRDRVAEMLWPDSDGRRSRGALRRTLSVTRAAVGEALVGDRTAISLDRSRAAVDTFQFEALSASTGREELERAAGLYRDDFLSGFGLKDSPEFDDWQEAAAQEWRSRFASVLEQLVVLAELDGDQRAAIEWGRRRVGLDPLHEPAHQALIRLLLRAGQRGAAVRQYRECVQILGRELGVAPLPETTAAYEAAVAPVGEDGPGGRPPAPRIAEPRGRPPTPPAGAAEGFVGREAELARLRAGWERIGPGGRAIVVSGEPGAGKTALVQRFAAEVGQAGAAVLRTRCHEGEGGIPYGAASELLAAAFAHSPGLAHSLPPQVLAEVARLRPELGRPAPTPELDADPRRPTALVRLLNSIADAVVAATQGDGSPRPPGLVIVEDAHRADPRSQELLVYLLNRLERVPVLLVLTWVADGSEGLRPLRRALARRAESGVAETLELSRFGLPEVTQLLEADGVPGADPERILAETRGLPLLVRAYAHQEPGSGPEGEPPPSVAGLMRAWIDDLPEPARQLVSAAAALEGTFDHDLLRSVSGRGDAEVDEALELALQRSLLVLAPDPGPEGVPQFDFPYEALRRVAYNSSTATRRRIVHRRAAEALVRRHERDTSAAAPGTIARHWQLAGREPEAAGWWWRAAVRARSVYAHEEALDRIAQALALGHPRLPALLESGEVLTTLGRYREALNAFQAAAAEAGGAEGSAAAIERKIAEVYSRLGEAELAETHYGAALELVPAGDLAAQAWMGAELALVSDRAGHPERARAAAARALEQARRTADGAAHARALNSLGVLAARRRRVEEAEALLSEALAHATAAGSRELEVAALNNLARVLADAGRREAALEVANRALEVGSRLGDQHRLAALHTNLADILHAQGREEAAREHVLESARRFAVLDSSDERQPAIWELVEW